MVGKPLKIFSDISSTEAAEKTCCNSVKSLKQLTIFRVHLLHVVPLRHFVSRLSRETIQTLLISSVEKLIYKIPAEWQLTHLTVG